TDLQPALSPAEPVDERLESPAMSAASCRLFVAMLLLVAAPAVAEPPRGSITYTTPRLGTPVQNPDIYNISAPIQHMDQLVRPLLILQGTNDTNVSFVDSLRLFDVLIKLGKPFESQIYPGEIHFFRRAIVLRDAWKRVEDFFDRTVRNGPAMSSSSSSAKQ